MGHIVNDKQGSFVSVPKVLIVDNETAYVTELANFLQANELKVHIERNGNQAIARVQQEQPDVVILEVDLPGENGLTVCKLMRRDYQGVVIILSHRADELDQVLGLDMGADDYIAKQMSHRVILARIHAHLRPLLQSLQSESLADRDRLEFGELVIDNSMREAWLQQQPIDLTSAEFDLLWLLSSNAGKILTREEIFHRLRGIEYDGQDRSVDVRVSRIRPKVGDNPVHPRRIKTVRSKGYLFVGDIGHQQQPLRH